MKRFYYSNFILVALTFITISGYAQTTTNPDYLLSGRDELPESGVAITDTFFFFDRATGAFRGGTLLNSINWSPDSLAGFSFAYGIDVVATGFLGATALGFRTSASGSEGATALGHGTIASGDVGASAIGLGTKANGSYGDTALGSNTTASGDEGATALGFNTTASGNLGATALGRSSKANGNSCTVVGEFNDPIVVSKASVSPSSPLFIVGNGFFGNESNAMVVRKDGRVGIGTNVPEGLTHISAGLSGDSELIIESDTDNSGSEADNPTISLRQDGATITGFLALEGDAGATSTGTISNSMLFGSEKPNVPLHFITNDISRMTIHTNGHIAVNELGSAGATQVCRNGLLELATCSSSIRYKKEVNDYNAGLKILNQLRPVSYLWKESDTPDVGFIAEEIALLDERLITRNDKGEVEGVKYDRLTIILVNAIKEQQDLIKRQMEIIDEERRISKEQGLQLKRMLKHLNLSTDQGQSNL